MSLARSTILLVEDDPNDIFLFQRTIKNARHTKSVHVLTHGEDLMAYLDGQGQFADRKIYPIPSLIFLDLKLPGLSGFEILTWIRQQPKFKRIQVVVLTGSPLTIDIYRAYDLGANAYLVKPIKLDDLEKLPKTLSLPHPILPAENPGIPRTPTSSTIADELSQ